MNFGEKLRYGRKQKGLTQQELAERCHISKRTIASYESDGRLPHKNTLRVLAAELGYTAEYMKDDSASVFTPPTEEESYISGLREVYGDETADEISELISRSASLFAGGRLAQEAKDKYFLALTNAYIACKKAAEEET